MEEEDALRWKFVVSTKGGLLLFEAVEVVEAAAGDIAVSCCGRVSFLMVLNEAMLWFFQEEQRMKRHTDPFFV